MNVSKHRRPDSGFILLDLAALVMVLVLVAILQFAINQRDQERREEEETHRRLKFIAKAQEAYFAQEGRYASSFRELAPLLSSTENFLDPSNGEIFNLYIDEVGRYVIEADVSGLGRIVSGDPDWE
jgi:type II secretory pathway pseudopilin PulG